jgi:hypothetical protein
MIFEYALDPELVASWQDRNLWRFFDGKFGIGRYRVACSFPSKHWEAQVWSAFHRNFPQADATKQNAKKRLDVLLQHLSAEMARRQGVSPKDTPWLEAVLKEHNDYPFKGIILKSPPTSPKSHLLCADELDEKTESEWNPKRPVVLRQTAELAEALSPLLRCCTEARFVDPYFDANDPTFREPFGAFLEKAQARREPSAVKIELHTSVKGAQPIDPKQKFADCEIELRRFLKPNTKLRVFIWDEGIHQSEKFHNRYVLTNLGSVAVQAGLDRTHYGSAHTDDLTLLSKEQHVKRWEQYKEGSKAFRCLLGPEIIA